MKRFHVHVSVSDFSESLRFYSSLFDAAPSLQETDYAKWLLDDPPVNFALSAREGRTGINHLGIQVDTHEELQSLEGQLRRADNALQVERDTTCCYAKSDKYWVTDPQGVRWETFHTHGSASVDAASPVTLAVEPACCAPPAAAAGRCCAA